MARPSKHPVELRERAVRLVSVEMEGLAPVGLVGTLVTLVVRGLDVHPNGI